MSQKMFMRACRAYAGAFFCSVLSSSLCVACEKPVPYFSTFCPFCANLVERDGAFIRYPSFPFEAPFLYGGAMAQAILKMKLGRKQVVANRLSKLFADSVVTHSTFKFPIDLVMPVPMHPSKLISRGFSPALIFARAIARACSLPLETSLLAVRVSKVPQLGLSAQERAAKVDGLFYVTNQKASRKLHGKTVLLVDDVLTTGATLGSAARSCLDAGVASVCARSLARTPKTGV